MAVYDVRFVPATKLTVSQDSGSVCVPVCLISLDGSEDRRNILVERGFPKEWVDDYWSGIDLRKSDNMSLRNHIDLEGFERRYGRKPKPGEIGCRASHTSARNWLAQSEFDLALILEDDILFTSENWLEQLKQTVCGMLPRAREGEAAICNLGRRAQNVRATIKSLEQMPPEQLYLAQHGVFDRSQRKCWLAHAMLMTKEAAKRFVNSSEENSMLADDWRGAIEGGLLDRLYMRRNSLIVQDRSQNSLIGAR